MNVNLPSGVFFTNYSQDMAVVQTKVRWGWLVACLLVFAAFPTFLPAGFLSVLIYICITTIMVQGLNILTGYCGQISLGHAAFMGVGAYTSAVMVSKYGLPFWLALPSAGLTAGVVGMIFGAPALRIKGFYLALSTLAAQVIIDFVLVHWSLTGGAWGLQTVAPKLWGLSLDTDFKYYYLVFAVAVIMTYFAKRLTMTRTGRAFVAIRDNDMAAQAMGVNIYTYKLLAFFIGCFYAGISGALFVHYMRLAYPEYYGLVHSVLYLGILVVGGMGSIVGPIFGAFFITGLQEVSYTLGPPIAYAVPFLFNSIGKALPDILVGLVFMLVLIFEPRGLAHRWELFKMSYRLWPFSY